MRGTLVGLLGFTAQLLQGIAVVPLMLEGWGASQYALWITCQASVTMLLTVEAGHQAYVGNELAKSIPVDPSAARVTLGSSLRFATLLALGETVLLSFIYAAGLSHLFLGVSEREAEESSLGAALLMLLTSWLLVGSWGGILARLYGPTGRYSRSALWSLLQRVVVALTVAAAALLHCSILQTAVAASIVNLVLGSLQLRDAARLFGEFRPFLERGTLAQGRRTFALSLTMTLAVLISQLQSSGLVLCVSSLLGSAQVASLVTVRTLANSLAQAASLVFTPMITELVRMHAQLRFNQVRIAIFGLSATVTTLCALGALLLAQVGAPLYETWTRHKVGFDGPLLHCVLASLVWRVFGTTLANHMNAMNNLRWITASSLIQAGLLFGLAIPAAGAWGLLGVGGALLIGEISGSVLIPTLWLHSELPLQDRRAFLHDQLQAALIPAVATLGLLGASVFASFQLEFLGIAALLLLLLLAWLLRRIPENVRRDVGQRLFEALRLRAPGQKRP